MHPFPFLMGRIFREHLSGRLRVKKGDLKKEILFKDGQPIEVRSNIIDETLGRFLKRNGKISPEVFDESHRRVGKEKKKHGEILIEMGAISHHDLSTFLQQQLLEKLVNLFGWDEGTYRFYPQDNVNEPEVNPEFSPPVIIYRGILSNFSDERVKAFLDDFREQVLVRDPRASISLEEMKLKPAESRIVSTVDGKKTVADLLEKFGEGARKLLYSFIVLKVLVPKITIETSELHSPKSEKAPEPPPSPAPASPPAPEQPVPSPTEKSSFPPEEADQAKMREELRSDYEKIRDQDYFGVLGVEQGAPVAQIKKSYFKLAKKYHPDHYSSMGDSEIKELANNIFSAVSQAFSEIGNEEGRKNYLERITASTQSDDFNKEAQDLINAEIQFQKGEVFLKKREYDQAIEAFEWAKKLNPKEPEYQMLLGWATYKKYSSLSDGEGKVNQAVRLIERSIEANPKLDRGLYYLGLINKLRGRDKEAEQFFRRAVDVNPKALDAVRELRLFEMRKEKTPEKKRSLGRFFKR